MFLWAYFDALLLLVVVFVLVVDLTISEIAMFLFLLSLCLVGKIDFPSAEKRDTFCHLRFHSCGRSFPDK